MRKLIYHLRYAFYLWQHVPDMTLGEAWRYPRPQFASDGDPIEDAATEIGYMSECQDGN